MCDDRDDEISIDTARMAAACKAASVQRLPVTAETRERLAHVHVTEPPSAEAPEDWLAEYEALNKPAIGRPYIHRADGGWVWVIMDDGDHIAEFYGSIGSTPPQDPRRNAVLFVKAWEAAHLAARRPGTDQP